MDSGLSGLPGQVAHQTAQKFVTVNAQSQDVKDPVKIVMGKRNKRRTALAGNASLVIPCTFIPNGLKRMIK